MPFNIKSSDLKLSQRFVLSAGIAVSKVLKWQLRDVDFL